jgi:hypothetical protein
VATSLRLLVLLIAVVGIGLAVRAALDRHSDGNTSGGLLESATVAAESTATANLRSAEISLEAWRADHGTYEGATVEGLHRYDYGVRDVLILHPTRDSYCLESRVGNAVASKEGPGGQIALGPCSG